MFHSMKKEDKSAQNLNQVKNWIAYSERKRREDGASVTERLTKLDSKVSKLGGTLSERLDELDSEASKLDGTLSERLTELDSEVSKLDGTLSERLTELDSEVSKLDGTLSERLTELDSEVSKLDGTLSELREAANRHDLAIADMLDSWDEWRQNREETDNSLLEAISERARQEKEESQSREDALVSLAAACFDQLHTLRRTAKESGDQTWLRQLELAEEKLSAERLLADMQIIDSTLCEVNYNLYEISAVVDTEDPDLAMRIADVYSPGFVYRGRVLRKAVATAYRVKPYLSLSKQY